MTPLITRPLNPSTSWCHKTAYPKPQVCDVINEGPLSVNFENEAHQVFFLFQISWTVLIKTFFSFSLRGQRYQSCLVQSSPFSDSEHPISARRKWKLPRFLSSMGSFHHPSSWVLRVITVPRTKWFQGRSHKPACALCRTVCALCPIFEQLLVA